LALGRRHSEAHTVAEAINHAANYWKHHSEWHWVYGTRRHERTFDAIDSCGFIPDPSEYPLSGILTELVTPSFSAFIPLVPKLEEWRNQLDNSGRSTTGSTPTKHSRGRD
jgi:hypothetical protein